MTMLDHTQALGQWKIASFGWKTLPHPPYSPDLVPSDYHLFGPMKERFRGKHYSGEICREEVAQRTVNSILLGKDTSSHSKVEHCY